MSAEYKVYIKPETNMELVKRSTQMILNPMKLKNIMAKKAKEIGSTKTSVIIDAVVSDYMATNKHDIKKDFSPGDFALWVNMQ